jgi:hypothetical protein
MTRQRVTGGEDEILAVFRRVRGEIDSKLQDWLAEQGVLAAS